MLLIIFNLSDISRNGNKNATILTSGSILRTMRNPDMIMLSLFLSYQINARFSKDDVVFIKKSDELFVA